MKGRFKEQWYPEATKVVLKYFKKKETLNPLHLVFLQRNNKKTARPVLDPVALTG